MGGDSSVDNILHLQVEVGRDSGVDSNLHLQVAGSGVHNILICRLRWVGQ